MEGKLIISCNRFLYAIGFLAFLGGCASSAGTGILASTGEASKIIQGKDLDEDDVRKTFGEPNSIYKKDGQDVFEYEYVKMWNNPASFIPLVSFFVKPNSYTIRQLYVYFGKNGKISSYDENEASGDYPPDEIKSVSKKEATAKRK